MEEVELHKKIKKSINNEVAAFHFDSYYEGLYEPLGFSINLPSKRVRPILCILAAMLYSGSEEEAMDAALGIEYFHTFTLIHDDIMDDAEMRRGESTLYKKNGLNTAILSGDVLYTIALQKFESYDAATYKQIMVIFNEASKKVCEGQQKDMEFESAENIELSEYLKMIENKTAVLAAAALKIGAVIGKASESDQKLIYDLGINIGMTFQLMDDYLDSFGDELKFGKKIGGDIIQKKKTYLLLKSLESLESEQSSDLRRLIENETLSEKDKINKVKAYFTEAQADKALLSLADTYYKQGKEIFAQLQGNESIKNALNTFVSSLLNRNF